MKISFCTSCAQRLYQLEQTWNSNIEIIRNNPNAEWVVLNYDGDDMMHKFVMDRRNIWPDNFVYAKELSNHDWHMSVAKNISHQLGSGKILFSLDCDNFIGNAIDMINVHYKDDIKFMHFYSGIPYDGTCGRIAIDKKIFFKLGGYNEDLYPMAGQDNDILARGAAMGYKRINLYGSTKNAIKNTKEDSVKLCKHFNMTWKEFSRLNRVKIQENLKNAKYVANIPNGMTKPNVEIFRGSLYY